MQSFTKISLRFLSILALLGASHQAFGMHRAACKIASVAAAAVLINQKRSLCGNQAQDPMWLKANNAVENFRKKHGLKKLRRADLDQILSDLDKAWMHNFDNDSKSADLLRPIVEPYIKKHGLDPAKIKIVVDKSLKDAPAAAAGNLLFFHSKFLTMSPSWQRSAIEHELGHILCHDAPYRMFYRHNISQGSDIDRQHILLLEQRADTHSALQSIENTKALLHWSDGYAVDFKKYKIQECELDQTLDPIAKEQKLQKLKTKPNYLEQLLAYMSKKEQ